MANYVNWARMTTSSGGTGTLVLEEIADTPTFEQDPDFGPGSTTGTFVIAAPGMYEACTAIYNGTTKELSSRTVIESWADGVFGTSLVDFPTVGVTVYSAPLATSISDAIAELALGSAATAESDDFADADHVHDLDDLSDVDMTGAAEGKVLRLDASLVAIPTTLTLDDFASDSIEGDASNRFVIWDTGTSEYIPATAAQVLALLGDDTACPIPPVTANGDYTISLYMPFAGTITGLVAKDPAGTCTLDVKIGSTSITGLSAVSVTTTKTTTSATAANTFAAGAELNMTVTSASSLTGVLGMLLITRTAG